MKSAKGPRGYRVEMQYSLKESQERGMHYRRATDEDLVFQHQTHLRPHPCILSFQRYRMFCCFLPRTVFVGDGDISPTTEHPVWIRVTGSRKWPGCAALHLHKAFGFGPGSNSTLLIFGACSMGFCSARRCAWSSSVRSESLCMSSGRPRLRTV